jgi:hypothetical protein
MPAGTGETSLFRSLEEQAEAAARQSANDASGNDVLHAAESSRSKTSEDHAANASEDVGVCRDFEFFISHVPNSSFVPWCADFLIFSAS